LSNSWERTWDLIWWKIGWKSFGDLIVRGFEIMDVDNGFYMVKCELLAVRERTVSNGPWMLFDHYLEVTDGLLTLLLHMQKWKRLLFELDSRVLIFYTMMKVFYWDWLRWLVHRSRWTLIRLRWSEAGS
jgi:hypothetical protein